MTEWPLSWIYYIISQLTAYVCFTISALYLVYGSPAVVFRLVGSVLSFVVIQKRPPGLAADTSRHNAELAMTVFDREFELEPSEQDLAVLRGLHKRRSCCLRGISNHGFST